VKVFPFQIKPDDVTQEILDFNRKLAEGLKAFARHLPDAAECLAAQIRLCIEGLTVMFLGKTPATALPALDWLVKATGTRADAWKADVRRALAVTLLTATGEVIAAKRSEVLRQLFKAFRDRRSETAGKILVFTELEDADKARMLRALLEPDADDVAWAQFSDLAWQIAAVLRHDNAPAAKRLLGLT